MTYTCTLSLAALTAALFRKGSPRTPHGGLEDVAEKNAARVNVNIRTSTSVPGRKS